MENLNRLYTTEELAQFLEQELMACIKGQRTFPMPADAEEVVKQYPLGSILGAQKMFRVGCYHEFRDLVRDYQLKHNISGLEVKPYVIGNKSYRFSTPNDQLDLTKDDYDVLKLSKSLIIDAFLGWCNKNTYLGFGHEDKSGCYFSVETTPEYVRHFAEYCDWAEISHYDDLEVTLRLGYGDYHESAFMAKTSELARYSDSVYFCAMRACEIKSLQIKSIKKQ